MITLNVILEMKAITKSEKNIRCVLIMHDSEMTDIGDLNDIGTLLESSQKLFSTGMPFFYKTIHVNQKAILLVYKKVRSMIEFVNARGLGHNVASDINIWIGKYQSPKANRFVKEEILEIGSLIVEQKSPEKEKELTEIVLEHILRENDSKIALTNLLIGFSSMLRGNELPILLLLEIFKYNEIPYYKKLECHKQWEICRIVKFKS